jgi:hypothetical protein
MHSHGPFRQNHLLERIRLDTVFVIPAAVRQDVQMRADDWTEQCMAKLEKSLKYLKDINDRLCVEVRPRMNANVLFQVGILDIV